MHVASPEEIGLFVIALKIRVILLIFLFCLKFITIGFWIVFLSDNLKT